MSRPKPRPREASSLAVAAHLSTSWLDPSRQPSKLNDSEPLVGAMADHIATAQRYRARAAKCEVSAKATSSAKFGECYRLLAQHFLVLANLEEDCAHRSSPFARQDNKQDSNPSNDQENNKAANQAPAQSVAARMFAVQMAAPSMATVSMPPMVAVAIPSAEFGR